MNKKKNTKAATFAALYPNLCYFEYSKTLDIDKNTTNIGYRSMLNDLIKNGNRGCRKQAHNALNLFDHLAKNMHLFG